MSVNSRFMARNRRSCFHSDRTEENGSLQMFLCMCNDTTSPNAQEPSAVFDKTCRRLCVTCRFIHINFCHLYIQRQACFFNSSIAQPQNSPLPGIKPSAQAGGEVVTVTVKACQRSCFSTLYRVPSGDSESACSFPGKRCSQGCCERKGAG